MNYGEIVTVLHALPALVHERRARDRLSLRAAASRMGLSADTVDRVERGEPVSLATAIMLLRWLAS